MTELARKSKKNYYLTVREFPIYLNVSRSRICVRRRIRPTVVLRKVNREEKDGDSQTKTYQHGESLRSSGMFEGSGASAPIKNGSDAASQSVHRHGVSSSMRFANGNGIGAPATDAAMWLSRQPARGTQCVLPSRRAASQANPCLRRRSIWNRTCVKNFRHKVRNIPN